MKLRCLPEDFQVEELATVEQNKAGPFSLYRMTKRSLTTPDAIDAEEQIKNGAGHGHEPDEASPQQGRAGVPLIQHDVTRSHDCDEQRKKARENVPILEDDLSHHRLPKHTGTASPLKSITAWLSTAAQVAGCHRESLAASVRAEDEPVFLEIDRDLRAVRDFPGQQFSG